MHDNSFTASASPFSIKDLMLGELLCQSGVLSDVQLLRATTVARAFSKTIGWTICEFGWLTARELFAARKTLNRYLSNPEKIDDIMRLLKGSIRSSSQSIPDEPVELSLQIA